MVVVLLLLLEGLLVFLLIIVSTFSLKPARPHAHNLASAILLFLLCSTTNHQSDCVELSGHNHSVRYLRADSSIDCHSPRYKAFEVAAALFVVIYQVGGD